MSRRLITWMFLALLAAVLPGSAAELTPRGPEFVVNQFTKGFQSTPDLASLGTAGMVGVWMENGEAPGGIKARFLDAVGTPVGEEFWVEQGAIAGAPPRVASNGNGLFVVVWGSDSLAVWGRLFQGEKPLGGSFQISPPVTQPMTYAIPGVGMDAAGNFTVTWLQQVSLQEHRIMARRFGPDGAPAGEASQVNQSQILGATSFIDLRLALHPDGGFVVTWNAFGVGARLRRFNGSGQSWEAEVFLNLPIDFMMPVLYPEGDGAIVWVDSRTRQVKARRFDLAGRPQGETVVVGFYEDAALSPAVVALNKASQALVVWPGHNGITGRLYDRFWQPLDAETLISLGEFPETEPAVVASPSGGFTALWTTGLIHRGTLPGIPLPPATGRDGDLLGIAGRGIAGVCAPDAETLCLGQGGRFATRVSWKRSSGEEGVGHPLALTRDTGAFWFFGAENLELMVKMIDGQEVNGYHWVYTGALSDVEYTLTVRDTVTGAEKSYRNPPGRIASRADVEAFRSSDRSESDTPIAGAAEALFLGDQQRFRVAVEFYHPLQSGEIRQATAIPLTGDTGAFWFFNARNLELMIKVLDGRSVNGHFWVYYGSLSDVRYKITVTDTVTGATKTYQNASGQLVSRADTGAF